MKKNKYNPNQTGRVNYIWVLAGGYLIYLAYKLLRGLFLGRLRIRDWRSAPQFCLLQ